MLQVLWTPAELDKTSVQDRPVVIIDVVRATTTMMTAIHSGARAIVPVDSAEEALRIANSIGRDQVLLGGERDGLPIEGFDLGNSPAEFVREVVAGRTIVMATTNGTRTLRLLAPAGTVYVGAFVNLGALARELSRQPGDPLIVCAGRQGRIGADDALCAGMLVEAWLKRKRRKASSAEMDDGAIAALSLAKEHAPVTVQFLRRTAAGLALARVGLQADLERCAQVDSMRDLAVLSDSQVVRMETTAASPS